MLWKKNEKDHGTTAAVIRVVIIGILYKKFILGGKKNCFRLPAYFWIWVTSSEIRRLLESTEKFPFPIPILTKNSVRSEVCLAYHCIHEPYPISPSRITYSSRIKYLSLHMAILVGVICISSGTTKLWPSKRQDLLHLWVPKNNHCDWCRE